MHCHYCQRLSISKIVSIVEREGFTLEQEGSASTGFYKHQKSIQELEDSAKSGCDFCLPVAGMTALNQDAENSITNIRAKEVSDIRISIGATHVDWDEQDLSKVTMFDYSILQAGDDTSWIPRSSYLILSSEEATWRRYLIGRRITDPDLGAASNFGLIRGWINECSSKHEHCPCDLDVLLPTRVIDVGDGNGHAPFLFVSNGTARGRYAALSHC